jgi:hypothetical protein
MKRNTPGGLRVSGWTIVAVLLAATLGGVTAGVVGLGLTTSRPSYVHGRTGEVVRVPGYELEIQAVRTDAQGDEVFKPGTGREYYVLAVEIKNTGKGPMAVAPVVQTVLQDQAGARYEMAPTSLAKPLEAGTLAAGATRRGELSYNVAAGANGLQFVFAPGAGLKPLAISLPRE